MARIKGSTLDNVGRFTHGALAQTDHHNHARPVLNYTGTKLMFDSPAGTPNGGGQEASVAAGQNRLFQAASKINRYMVFEKELC